MYNVMYLLLCTTHLRKSKLRSLLSTSFAWSKINLDKILLSNFGLCVALTLTCLCVPSMLKSGLLLSFVPQIYTILSES